MTHACRFGTQIPVQVLLERFADGPEARAVDARREQLLALLPHLQHLPWPDGRSSRELQEEIYGADGLPA